MNAPRYAVYYAPAVGSAWWRFGASWVGRDEKLDTPLPQPALPGFAPGELRHLTGEPRRYGFHATLKAPFRLHERVTQEQLLRRVDALALRLQPEPLGHLVPARLDDFVALVRARRSDAVEAAAAGCVMGLDDLRAPLTPAELARRHPDRLDETERQLLLRYGYPHVLERFRFHMTLSGPVDAASAERLVRAAEPLARALNESAAPRLDRVCVFREAAPGAAFVRIHDAELGA